MCFLTGFTGWTGLTGWVYVKLHKTEAGVSEAFLIQSWSFERVNATC
jgi:hypothetical protein